MRLDLLSLVDHGEFVTHNGSDTLTASVQAKLDSIEFGATTVQTAPEILTLLKTVDGSGSGLDADLLDGQEGAYYLDASNINAGTIDDARLPATITSDITGNAATATKLETARTITLSGDVTGNVSFDGSANVTIATTVQPNSVALGTDTTGNYMVGITAGSGISVSHIQGEGSVAAITNSAPNVTTDITTTHNSTNVIVHSSDGTDGAISAATTSLAGVMTGADKTKLNGIETNAKDDQVASEVPVTPRGNLSSNQVQAALEEIMDKIYDIKEW